VSYFPLPWLHKIISQRYAKNPWFEGNEKRSRMILNDGVSKKTLFSLLLPKQSIIFALPNACRLQSAGNTGGLIYEKDVFERLSLCSANLTSSKHHSRQMATMCLRGT